MIPEKYQSIIEEFVKQLEEFEKAYGYLPECRLVVKKDYETLVKRIQSGELTN
ncbi:hypothetical protein [Argonema galeatum]|uniref:hypothetical protein n=1 Tax=Argonema galeatum TaxID=2942762 RepID=UPI00201345DB|nr:hypothetical protein [Argonema galeatum]MCL1468681.1 hypothetical protein [Argonema galeatum A003/A1]